MLLALCGATLLVAPAAALADLGRGCGRAIDPVDGGPFHVRVLRGSVSCATARRVLRQYFASHARCTGSACVRTHRGWTCGTAADGAFPRLASCTSKRSTIAAYSYAD